MEVNEYSVSRADTAARAEPHAPVQDGGAKSGGAVKLAEGDVLKGEILDIKQNEVTIKLPSGDIVNAKLTEQIDAKIGQTRAFSVKGFENGSPVVEMKALPQAAMQKSVISEALSSFGIKPTDNNINLAKVLLNNQIPLTKDNMQKLNQAIKLLGGDISPQNIQKALFLIDNKINLSPRNVQTLTGFTDGQIKLSNQLSALVENIGALPDGPLKNSLLTVLVNGEAALGDAAIIRNAAEQLARTAAEPGSGAQLKNEISRAFEQKPLSLAGFEKLAAALIEKHPEQEQHIKALLAEKQSFVTSMTQNKDQLLHNIREMIRGNNLSEESLVKLMQAVKAQSAADAQPLKASAQPELKADVKLLAEALFTKGDPIADKILDIFRIAKSEQPPSGNTLEKLLFKFENTKNPKEIDSFLNSIKENVETAKSLLPKSGSPETAKIMESANHVRDNLEFVASAKQNLFAQIPIAVLGREADAELFVFRDKSGKKQAGGKASALIALDTLSLGRFEAYVQKDEKTVVCQFRLRDAEVEKLVRENIPTLHALLADKNFKLANYSCKMLSEPFTVVDAEPGEEEGARPAAAGRISFDMRT